MRALALLLILLAASLAEGQVNFQPYRRALPVVAGGGGLSCPASNSPTLGPSIYGSDLLTGSGSYYYYGTIFTNGAASSNLCAVGMIVFKRSGSDISTNTYTVQVWSLSGNNLGSVVYTSSSLTGDNAWAYPYFRIFSFSGAALSPNTRYGLALTCGVDSPTYTSEYSSGGQSGIPWGLDIWNSAGTSGGHYEPSSLQASLKLYFEQ